MGDRELAVFFNILKIVAQIDFFPTRRRRDIDGFYTIFINDDIEDKGDFLFLAGRNRMDSYLGFAFCFAYNDQLVIIDRRGDNRGVFAMGDCELAVFFDVLEIVAQFNLLLAWRVRDIEGCCNIIVDNNGDLPLYKNRLVIRRGRPDSYFGLAFCFTQNGQFMLIHRRCDYRGVLVIEDCEFIALNIVEIVV